MVKVKELLAKLNTLYDYGETGSNPEIDYLVALDFLNTKKDRVIITKRWIGFSGLVTREDFISYLACWYPPLLDYLLHRVYREACSIGQSGDGNALFEFIDSIPQFAQRILELRDRGAEETDEVKGFYTPLFGGHPSYLAILARLKCMQKAVDVEDANCQELGKTPDEVWTRGRKVTSSVTLSPLKIKNKYTLTPYDYVDYPATCEFKELLSYPWKTFIAVLGMVISEYRVEGFEGLSLRPSDISNPYLPQPLEVFFFNTRGREVKAGPFKDLTYALCRECGFLLFPDRPPDIEVVLFQLIDEEKFIYKGGEYLLHPDFEDRLYSDAGRVLKNRSRRFKNIVRHYVEQMRRTL